MSRHHASDPPKRFRAPAPTLVPWPRFAAGPNIVTEVEVQVTTDTVSLVQPVGGFTSRTKLVAVDQNGVATSITVERTAPLKTFMDAYCGLKSVSASRVRFMVDGDILHLDHDEIEAFDTEGLHTSNGWVLWT